MKEYVIDGKHYLYKEGEQPKGAVEFKKNEPKAEAKAEPKVETKAAEPKNKARETKKK